MTDFAKLIGRLKDIESKRIKAETTLEMKQAEKKNILDELKELTGADDIPGVELWIKEKVSELEKLEQELDAIQAQTMVEFNGEDEDVF